MSCPKHVGVGPEVGADKPRGSVSVKFIPLNVAALSVLSLRNRKVSVAVPPTFIPFGEKDFVRMGGPTTVITAFAGSPGKEFDAPINALLVCVTGVIPTTSIANVHVPPTGNDSNGA